MPHNKTISFEADVPAERTNAIMNVSFLPPCFPLLLNKTYIHISLALFLFSSEGKNKSSLFVLPACLVRDVRVRFPFKIEAA